MRLPPAYHPRGCFRIVGDFDQDVLNRLKEKWLEQLPNMRVWMTPVFKSKPSYNHQLKKLIKRRS